MYKAFILVVLTGVLYAQAPSPHAAWTFHTHAKAPNKRSAEIAAFEATPVLGGNLLYVITPFDQVIALDPGTGAEKWRFDPQVRDLSYSEASARGVTVADGKVYLGTLDARLVALRADNGELLWNVQIAAGVVDGEYQITSPPVLVGKGSGQTVIVGSSISDNGRAEMERGVVRGFDAGTGRLKWSWDPTPAGKTGAANAWAPLAVDAARDMVLIPTGSASPDFYGGLRPGNDLYANSVVALRASTGERLWYFQVVHHDLWDYDVASSPVLVTGKGGKPEVAILTKMGHYFLLDRDTGKPLLPVSERPVPKSDVPGETASLTQPIPESGVFTEQTFIPRAGWCEDEFKKLRYDGLFTPPSLGGSLEFPGNVGGANWGGGAYDPQRGLVFVAANRLATAVRLIPRATFDSEGHGDTGERIGQEYARQAGTPYGMVRRTFLGKDGLPCSRPPWGALAAIEVATGKLRWETPTAVSLGGPLEVDGLVIFGGDLSSRKLRAYSADDGHKVWEVDLPHPSTSVPGTYIWKGKRYVVVCAGGHGKANQLIGGGIGDDVVAFTLE